jgi:hypothetical protein
MLSSVLNKASVNPKLTRSLATAATEKMVNISLTVVSSKLSQRQLFLMLLRLTVFIFQPYVTTQDYQLLVTVDFA